MTDGLSIVIPALNAAHTLSATLASLPPLAPAETVLVDGGSTDETVSIAEQAGCRIVRSEPGRGRQLSAGADAAHGDWLLFLHADTCLSPEAARDTRTFIRDEVDGTRAACFSLSFQGTHPAARCIASLANWRSRSFGLPYGDQGLLIHRSLYDSVGGYPDQPIMEDVAIVRAIRKARLHIFRSTVTTSAARYQRDGWIKRPLRNLTCLALYFAGISTARINRLYTR